MSELRGLTVDETLMILWGNLIIIGRETYILIKKILNGRLYSGSALQPHIYRTTDTVIAPCTTVCSSLDLNSR